MVGTRLGPNVTSYAVVNNVSFPIVHLLCWGGWVQVRLLTLVGVVLL